jgi:hypothetical protein
MGLLPAMRKDPIMELIYVITSVTDGVFATPVAALRIRS